MPDEEKPSLGDSRVPAGTKSGRKNKLLIKIILHLRPCRKDLEDEQRLGTNMAVKSPEENDYLFNTPYKGRNNDKS